MSNPVPGVTFSLSSMGDFSIPSQARAIIQCLDSAAASVRPTRFGAFEGRQPWVDVEEPLRFLAQPGTSATAGSLVLEAGSHLGYQVQWNHSTPPSFPFVSGFLMRKAFSKKPAMLDDFLALIKQLAACSNTLYGDIRSMEFAGWDTPFNLHLRLPEIPNISLYGKPYIELFGRQAIERAPFQRVEQLGDDLYWLEATAQITDPVPDEVRLAIRRHFGEDAFMAGKKWRYSEGRHPEFGG
ncbi:hypothetical protein [Pseudomonas sp. CF161]|uniref:hypothetical protein n=1 Tax=Pseudomonas sp. CF161 TaxID=911241 RepID=UPI0012EBCC34|nr:hypothetical protein [Pseudomonas sp. CF161]